MDRDRVLREMVESGLSATELGPDGYLPTDPVELEEFLDRFDMSIVGGFVPALLYRQDRVDDQLGYVTRAARQLSSTGSKVLVLGPSSANPGYDTGRHVRRRVVDISATCAGSTDRRGRRPADGPLHRIGGWRR
jgi:inosose dehydratase